MLLLLMTGTALNPGIMGGTASALTGDCGVDGQTSITVGSKVSAIKITHLKGVSVAPFTVFSSTTSTSWSATLQAGIDGTWSASAKADLILAKANASFSLSLHESGSKTNGGSESVTWSSGPAKSFARTYAVFAGGTRVTGTYTYQTCGRTYKWGPITSGTWGSWWVDREGSALCGYAYASGTIEKLALTQLGC